MHAISKFPIEFVIDGGDLQNLLCGQAGGLFDNLRYRCGRLERCAKGLNPRDLLQRTNTAAIRTLGISMHYTLVVEIHRPFEDLANVHDH